MVYHGIMTSKELKTWRIKKGYSQIELADILGVTNQTIFRWENDKRSIPSFLALALECVERKGDEKKKREMKKRKGVKK